MPFLDKLRRLRQNSVLECIFASNFTLVKSLTIIDRSIRELSDKNEQDERCLNSTYKIIKNKDTEITRLRNTITEAEAAHEQEICRLTAEHDAALQKAVEDTDRSVRARFEPLLEAAQTRIAELTEKIKSVFCAVRDICLGVSKIGYIDDVSNVIISYKLVECIIIVNSFFTVYSFQGAVTYGIISISVDSCAVFVGNSLGSQSVQRIIGILNRTVKFSYTKSFTGCSKPINILYHNIVVNVKSFLSN